jgi:EAL and modified HD-GYP domain-containing signal transduction protein
MAIDHNDSGAAFTVGLFSGLDALVDTPLTEALAELPLADELNEALLEHQGVFGQALGSVPSPHISRRRSPLRDK